MAAGCSASGRSSTCWVARAGGVLNDARQQRAEAVAARLTAGHPEMHVKVRVLASDTVCAFAWPERTVYVTRGLIDRADDAVLAAALAHEFGHLLSDGHVPSVTSLKGCDEDMDAEARADAYGVALLRRQGMPVDAMSRMLCIVRDSNALAPDCRKAMNHRIELLGASPTNPQN